jgi:hypothetical protein
LDRHGPNRFGSYREIHETVLNKFKDKNLVGPDDLRFRSYGPYIRLDGEIACLGEIVILVDKYLSVLEPAGHDDNAIVQTSTYAYNVSVRGFGNIFRYDNQHDDFSFRPSHADEHHKHLFNWRTDTQLPNSPIWTGYDKWPTLGEVIEEVEEWYWDHHDELPNPDDYPMLGLRNLPPSLEPS